VRRIRPQWVFHLAAHGGSSWQTDLDGMLKTNVAGTAQLIEACARTGIEAFVNAGSSSEYGFMDHAPREDEVPQPNSHYAVTKVFATMLAGCAARARRLRMRTLRLYSVYGPYENPLRLFPALIAEGLKGRLPPLVRPEIAHDFVYVDDVVDAFLMAASSQAGADDAVYNVGTGTSTTLDRLVAIARRVLPIAEAPRWGAMPDRHWDTSVWVADATKIRRELGWRPKFDVEAGFRAMADWLRDRPAMLRFYAERRGA